MQYKMENKLKILFLDKNHSILKNSLKKIGFIIDEKYYESKKEIESNIEHYSGIIIRNRFNLDSCFLKKAKKLKFVARVGSGIEHIDREFINKKNIKLINSPEGNQDSLAEHTLGMLLTLLHNIKISDSEIRNGLWNREKNRGNELMNKTIGLIGYGVMGKAFAKKILSLGVSILCYDVLPNKSDQFVQQVDLDIIIKKCEIISLHIPYNQSTKYFINEKFINKMKNSFYLVNTSRGLCVNTKDLIVGLKSGKIKGACLDVLEFENFSFENIDISKNSEIFNNLISSNKVILTPHIAGWSLQSNKKMALIIVDKIKKIFNLKNC